MSYSRKECIKAIHFVSEKIGESPSTNQYREHKLEKQPSVSYITREFNGWNNAKEKAGEELNSKRYTKQECINALKYVVDKLDKSPTIKEYKKHKKDENPTLRPIRNHFGSLNRLKQKLDLDYHKKNYDKQDCIDALTYVKEKINKSPTVEEYRENKKDEHPCESLISEKFSSFNDAKKNAGLDINKNTKKGYSKKECISALKNIRDKINESPSVSQYEKNRSKEQPPRNYISRKFGGWNQAKREAELEIYDSHSYTEEDCLIAIDFVSEKLGKSPTKKEYRENKKDEHPSPSVIENNFGSWDSAKKKLGLKTRSSYTREECVNSLEEVAEKLNRSPTREEYDIHRYESQPSSGTITKEFGLWNNARSELGLNTDNHNKCFRENMVKAILYVSSQIGGIPSVNQYDRNKRKSDPHSSTIREQLGSWNKAKVEAGFDINEDFNYTREECIKSLRNAAERIEKSPSIKEYDENKFKSEPSSSFITSEFETWNEAKKCAKLGTRKPKDEIYFDEQDCIDALIYVKNKLNKSPTKNEYTKTKLDDHPSSTVISNKFKTWNEAKNIANLELYRDGDNVSYPYGRNWSKKRREVLKRDEYKCSKCGLRHDLSIKIHNRGLDVHHIYKIADFYNELDGEDIDIIESERSIPDYLKSRIDDITDKSNHKSNLVSLCRDCHISMESKSAEEQIEILNIKKPEFRP